MGAHPTLETARALSDMSFPANGVDPLAGSGVEGLVELGRRPEYSFCTNETSGSMYSSNAGQYLTEPWAAEAQNKELCVSSLPARSPIPMK
jgi:hypothetical protein